MTRIRFFRLTMIGGVALLPVSCEGAPDESAARAEVAAVLASYRDAWLAGDAEAVMAHISDSVILYLPGSGAAPVIGEAAVRAHYFPAADTTYPIMRYEIRGQRLHVGATWQLSRVAPSSDGIPSRVGQWWTPRPPRATTSP